MKVAFIVLFLFVLAGPLQAQELKELERQLEIVTLKLTVLNEAFGRAQAMVEAGQALQALAAERAKPLEAERDQLRKKVEQMKAKK